MVWPASDEAEHDPKTGVDRNVLEKVGRASIAVPEGFVSLIPSLDNDMKDSVDFVMRHRNSILNCKGTSRIVCRALSLVKGLISLQQRWVIVYTCGHCPFI